MASAKQLAARKRFGAASKKAMAKGLKVGSKAFGAFMKKELAKKK